KDSNDDTNLTYLINMMPENLLAMLEFCIKDSASFISIMNLFMAVNKENVSAWQRLNDSAPQIRKDIVNFLIKKLTGIDYDFYANVASPDKLSFPELLLQGLMV